MITFNTWADVEKHYMSLPVKPFAISAWGVWNFNAQIYQKFFDWVEKNYIDTPTFTVKEQDSMDSSDAYDRSTCHN